MGRIIRVALLVAVACALLAAPARPYANAAARLSAANGGRIILDETFVGGRTTMPTVPGVLYVDGNGYEMDDTATNPDILVAQPAGLRPLATYSVIANLAEAQGPSDAPYGIALRAGSDLYAFEVRASGSYSVQRISGGHRYPLRDWTASGAISTGRAANELEATYAGGLLALSINGTMVGWATVPGAPSATIPGLVNEGSNSGDTLVRCAHFQVREGPVVALDDHFADNAGAWPVDGSEYTLAGDGYHLQRAPVGHNLSAFPGAVAPLGDVTASATVARVAGSSSAPFGLQFLAMGDPETTYAFLIDARGNYSLQQYQGRWSSLIDWTSSPALHAGTAPNELFLRYADGALALGANGTILRVVSLDDTPALGRVGLMVNPGLEVRYTHVLLAQSPGAAGQDPLQPAPALPLRRVVLADSFGDNRNGWYTDRTDVLAHHAYYIENTASGSAYRGWARRLRLTGAYSFAATVQLVSGTTHGYGLTFLDQSMVRGWDLYAYVISSAGYYSLLRHHNGVWTTVVPWTRTPYVARGQATNLLRVDVLGAIATLYANGQHLVDVTLPQVQPGPGTVGMATLSGGLVVAMRRAQVTALDGAGPPPAVTPRPPVIVLPTAVPTPATDPAGLSLQRVKPSVVHISVAASNGATASSESSGTGFIVRSDASGVYIVTAAHVLERVAPGDAANRLTITLQDGHVLHPVTFVAPYGAPSRGDVAVIKAAPYQGLSGAVARFGDSAQAQVGDQVWALGYNGDDDPGSLQGANNGAVPLQKAGVVEDTQVYLGTRVAYLTTNATVVEGFSGGPLAYVGPGDRAHLSGGEVLGIIDAYAGAVRAGGQMPNDNLVLPSSYVLPLVNALLARLHAPPLPAP